MRRYDVQIDRKRHLLVVSGMNQPLLQTDPRHAAKYRLKGQSDIVTSAL